MWLVSDLTPAGVALIWPAPALDPVGLLRVFAALLVACVVATLPRRWWAAGTAALVVALVFFALDDQGPRPTSPRSQCRGFSLPPNCILRQKVSVSGRATAFVLLHDL